MTPLANEGLIERSPRRGTFVREPFARLSSIACYFGTNLWKDTEGAFYQKAFAAIQALAHQRNIRCELFLNNSRLSERSFQGIPELAKAAQNREIQGLIGMMLVHEDIEWIEQLRVPYALLTGTGIHAEDREVLSLVLDRLAADGCRTVGLIRRSDQRGRELFQQMAQARGMRSSDIWCPLLPEGWNQGSERFAYQAFKHMWAMQDRPEGLYVEADWDCRGAITAMLELGVRIPENLKLVLYRNSAVPYVCPWSVPAIVLDTDEVASAFLDHVEAQHRSQRFDLTPPSLKVRLVA